MDFLYLCPSIVFLLTTLYYILLTCSTKNKDVKKKRNKGISRTPSVFAKDRRNKAKTVVIEVSSLKEERMNSSSISKKTKEKHRRSNALSSKEKNGNNLEKRSNNTQDQNIQQKNVSIKNATVHTFKTNNYNLQMTQKQPVGVVVDANQINQEKEAVENPKNVIDPVKTVDYEEESPNDKNKQVEDPIKTIMNEPDPLKCTQMDGEINTVVPGKLSKTQPFDLPQKEELKNGVPFPRKMISQKNNDGKSEVGSLVNDSKVVNDQYETLNNIEFAVPLPPQMQPSDNKSIKDVNVEAKMTSDKVDAEKNDDKKKLVDKKDVVINKKEEITSNERPKSHENKKESNEAQEKKSVTPKVENKDKKAFKDEKK